MGEGNPLPTQSERRDSEGARAAIVLDITEGAQPILAKERSRQSQWATFVQRIAWNDATD
jgi:hypothetical protein